MPRRQSNKPMPGSEWRLIGISTCSTDMNMSFCSTLPPIRARSIFSVATRRKLDSRLLQDDFDSLLVTGWYLKSFWQGIWAAKRCGLPVMVRGDSQIGMPSGLARRLVKGASYPLLLRNFDAALYVGERNRAYYENFGYPAKRLFHSPHCVDNEHFAAGAGPEARTALRARLGIAPHEKAVLFAGKLIDFKRPLDVIEGAALARSHGHPVHVIVAGSGRLEADVRARADTLHVPLHLLGFQNQTRMPAAYAAADALILPSTGRETWGLVCNESLACGTPIIVSDAVGCAPDLAGDGFIGRTFPVGNLAALADAISGTLLAPPSAEAIRKVSKRHDLSAAVAAMLAALQTFPQRRAKNAGD